MTRLARLAAVAVTVAVLPLAAACDTGTSAATNSEHPVVNGVEASQGTIVVRDAFIALQPNGNASVYAAFYNAGSAGDLLEGVTPGSAPDLPSYHFTVTLPHKGIAIPQGNGVTLLESASTSLPVKGLPPTVRIGDEVPTVFTFRDEAAVDLTLQVESPDGDASAAS